jgi:hypothetical protein
MKECILFNGKFSWILIVDGQTINFEGGDVAEYFAKHYEELSYKVTWKKEEVH